MHNFRSFFSLVLLLVAVFSTETAQADHPTFATAILEKSDNPVNQQFLDVILQKKYTELDDMLAAGANPNVADGKRVCPIHYAAFLGSTEALKRLIDKKANVEAAVFGGWRALHFAASGGQVEALKFLISAGATIDAPDVGGETPLFYAVEGGNIKAVQWLVEHGANVNHSNNQGETPLGYAKENGRADIEAYLREKGAKPLAAPAHGS